MVSGLLESEGGMRVLVCGGRDFSDFKAVDKLLRELKPSLIIEGGAKGADRLARSWAEQNGVPVMEFPAPWSRYGRGAGPVRNAWMLEWGQPDVVVAFKGGSGTTDMVERALRAGVDVLQTYRTEAAEAL